MIYSGTESSAKKGQQVISDVYYFEESQMLDCNQFIINDISTGELALFDSGNGISLKSLFEGMNNMSVGVVEQLIEYARGNKPIHSVNPEVWDAQKA